MKTTWQHARRRLKQGLAVAIFLTLLLGASGTVFSVVSSFMSHLGTGVPSVEVTGGSTSPATVGVGTGVDSGAFTSPNVDSPQAPVLEYSNPAPAGGASGNGPSPDPEDAANSALAAAMDTGGVYVGEKVSHVFGSVLKSVLNALFLNTN
ncbi:hypothetical protein [Alicyclobacillus acidocaldarius]|uniref:Uncharacterized protein n=1 Tax=Alicyclobacillus acidocaldarius (strain Tc-4-1) TaxID=1048834 RepID=F8IF60_ALIAT|nr:hypothetical protein [Alicyclobacillus acidocaldarius]AEJ44025.1 hypothetical protein TC41_2117 [Alicyclobacillus acidocaldarius subsp. acidocaldarius Tc-4-1]